MYCTNTLITVSSVTSGLLSKNIQIRIHKTISLPAILYGCETWSLTLMEEHRFRAFENRALRRIFLTEEG
jgi:membrane-bound acyltransferase YfiQ involved in biofilm formation